MAKNPLLNNLWSSSGTVLQQ